MNRVLMVAFHYPPMSGSSGVQRSLKYSAYLGDYGWHPTVLTAHPRVHPNVSEDQLAEIPHQVDVQRAFAFDTARHLSVFGRYPRFMAKPDRWMSWWFGGVVAGNRMIRRDRPQVIWSTFPIATAHWIAGTLARKNKLPWVADFRDSMTEQDFPPDPKTRSMLRQFEKRIVESANKVVFTTPGTLEMYRERYPHLAADKWTVLENGYDDESFAAVESQPHERAKSDRVMLVHSGLLYPSERDPSAFFIALSRLRDKGEIDGSSLQVVLRATGHDAVYSEIISRHRLEEIVELTPGVPYKDALREMLQASGLLIFQASNCNHQIPAKLYEYFRARRPIFALTDPDGDTATEMRNCGMTDIARIDDADEIGERLSKFISAIRRGSAKVADKETMAQYSRRSQTGGLAEILNSLSQPA